MAQMCDDMKKNSDSRKELHDPKARQACMKAIDTTIGAVAAMTVMVGALTAGFGGAALCVPVAVLLASLGKVATSDLEKMPLRNHAMQKAALANDPRRHTSTIMVNEVYEPEFYSRRA